MIEKLKAERLFKEKDASLAYPLIASFEYPWQAFSHMGEFILEAGKSLTEQGYEKIGDNIWVAQGVQIANTAYIKGPCIIGKGTEIRHCAYIRGGAVIGEGAVIGNSTEVKNSIIFDGVQIPHFNYVGDSILGYRAHMGAGAITSNVKADRTKVYVRVEDGKIDTGSKKFGAILGDFAEIGCNTVLNPGTVVGRNTSVYPLSSVRGFIPENTIYKSSNELILKRWEER